jgi:CAAX prenyl protease-like protein
MSILAVALITGLATAGFDYLYPVRILVASALLWRYRKYYEGMRFEVSWIAIAAGIGVLLFWVASAPAPADDSAATFADRLESMHPLLAGLWLFFRVVGSSLVIPLVEEIAFRGYLTRRIISADFSKIPMGQFSWLSFILSSLLFGLMHQRWIAGIAAGLVYALVLYRRRKLSDAVISHATTNLGLSIYVLFTRQWHLWI